MTQSISLLEHQDVQGNAQLYVQKVNAGVATEYPITSQQGTNNGLAHIVCGILIQWGSFTINNSPQAITFYQPFPAACYSITLTAEDAISPGLNYGIVAGTVTVNGFSAECNHTPRLIYYMAIGI